MLKKKSSFRIVCYLFYNIFAILWLNLYWILHHRPQYTTPVFIVFYLKCCPFPIRIQIWHLNDKRNASIIKYEKFLWTKIHFDILKEIFFVSALSQSTVTSPLLSNAETCFMWLAYFKYFDCVFSYKHTVVECPARILKSSTRQGHFLHKFSSSWRHNIFNFVAKEVFIIYVYK